MRLSIIIVNWNRKEDLEETLASFPTPLFPEWEVLVVDNGSTDDSLPWLRAQKGLTLIEAHENIGPARARNLALNKARGDYILFLDSDAEIRDFDPLHAQLDKMDADPSIGLVGFKILNAFSGDIDQWIYAENQDQYHDREFETSSFSAAGALMRRSLLPQVHGFWDDLFIYCEEVELSLKILAAGYRVLYSPSVEIFHRESPEGRVPSGQFFRLQARNWLWIFLRHFPGRTCWHHMILYTGVYAIKGALCGHFFTTLQGLREGWQGVTRLRNQGTKCSSETVARWKALNNRTSIKAGR